MKKRILLIVITALSVPAMAQAPADSIDHIVDSLFVRASNGSVMYTDLVAPSKKALADMGEAAIPRLIEKMKTQDAREMQTLEEVFKMIGRPAVSPLVSALRSDNAYRRRLSTRILGEIADTSSVLGLLGYIYDRDYRMRAGVLSALGKIGDQRGSSYARGALQDPDYLVRTAAAIALSNFKDTSTISSLIGSLSDPYYGVRFAAAEALANMGQPAVAAVKTALEKKGDSLSFYQLIDVAGKLGDDTFIPTLANYLNSGDFYTRAFAADALGRIGTEDAIKLLEKCYETETHPLVISKIEAVVLKTY